MEKKNENYLEKILKYVKELEKYNFPNLGDLVLYNIRITIIVGLLMMLFVILPIDIIYNLIITSYLEVGYGAFGMVSILIFNPFIWLFPFLLKKSIKKDKLRKLKYKEILDELKKLLKEYPNLLEEIEKKLKELSKFEVDIHYKFIFTEKLVDDFEEKDRKLRKVYFPEKFEEYKKLVLMKRKIEELKK